MNIELKKKVVSMWFKLLQNSICKDIEAFEKKNKFKSKTWRRSKNKNEGGGEFRILKGGKIFDKVGVNFSRVSGKLSNEMKKKNSRSIKKSKILGVWYICSYAHEKSTYPCNAFQY